MSTAATTTQAYGTIRWLPPTEIVIHSNKNQSSMANTAKAVSEKVIDGSSMLVDTNSKTETASHNNKDQESMANTAKVVSDKVVENSCELVNTGLKTAGSFTAVPSPVVDWAVDSCTKKTQPIVQKVARKVIDSPHCYGNQDSYVSKVTRTFSWLVSWLF